MPNSQQQQHQHNHSHPPSSSALHHHQQASTQPLPLTDPISNIVTTLMATAAENGYTVDAVSLQTPVNSTTTHLWPSVTVNGTAHVQATTQYQPAWNIQPTVPYPMHAYVPHYYGASYFATAAPVHPTAGHPHQNMFWSTVLPTAVQQQQQQQQQQPQLSASHDQASNSLDASHPVKDSAPKEFVCPRCNASFKTNSNMQKHVRTVHDNCRPFKCEKCDASYGHKNLLVEHVRTAHDGERPFVCETCGARFGRSSNLYSHMKSHDGKREHTCETCHVSFSLHGNMVKHIKTVHLKQRPFVCDVCSSRFGLRSDLTRHKRNVHGIVDKDQKSSGGRSFGSRITSTDSKADLRVSEARISSGQPDPPSSEC